MKILIINGSARKNGFCNTIATILKKELGKKDTETAIYTLAENNIKFCIGCLTCCEEEKKYCFIDDDTKQVYRLIEQADSIVYISPIYECFISGILKNFLDRINHYTSFYKLAGKTINLILSGVQEVDCDIKEFSNKHVIPHIVEYFKNYSTITHTQPVFLGFIHHDDHRSIKNKDEDNLNNKIREMAKQILHQTINQEMIENSKNPYIV